MNEGEESRGPAVGRALAAAARDRELWDRAERLAGLGTWEWDLDTGEVAWSDNTFRLMGWQPGAVEASAERVFDRMHPGDVAGVQERLRDALREGTLPALEYRIVAPKTGVRHLQSTPLGPGPEAGGRRLAGFLREVTEQRLAEREVRLHGAVARSLAGWSSFDMGARSLLAEISTALGVPAAGLWLPHSGVLAPRVLWTGAGVERRLFERYVSEVELPRGVGLAGLAWERRVPVTPATPGVDESLMGRLAAALDGISPAVAVPALSAGEVAAVIVLYAAEPLEAGERLLGALGQIGSELGTFLARRPGLLRWSLTPRETEVLTLAAEGLAGPEIAAALLVSAATVKTHLANAYAKIGVSNRVAAVAYALREGLIE